MKLTVRKQLTNRLCVALASWRRLSALLGIFAFLVFGFIVCVARGRSLQIGEEGIAIGGTVVTAEYVVVPYFSKKIENNGATFQRLNLRSRQLNIRQSDYVCLFWIQCSPKISGVVEDGWGDVRIVNGNGDTFEQYASRHSIFDVQSWGLPAVSKFYANVYLRICDDNRREEYRLQPHPRTLLYPVIIDGLSQSPPHKNETYKADPTATIAATAAHMVIVLSVFVRTFISLANRNCSCQYCCSAVRCCISSDVG